MKAVSLKSGTIYVKNDAPEPEPGPGQVLVSVKACGICGSDLHFATHGHKVLELNKELGPVAALGPGIPEIDLYPDLDLDQDVYMGHEFAVEVIEAGPDTDAPKAGTLVTSMPVLLTPQGIQGLTYSHTMACGMSERMLLSAELMVPVPSGCSAEHAALVEPMAVGLHAANRGKLGLHEGALVLGCGAVGLAIIAALKHQKIEVIVAADFSPARRALATMMGATHVVDAAVESAFDVWRDVAGARPMVAFDAIGAPGIIETLFKRAPHSSRLVVVGICLDTDHFNPFFAISKELNVQFCLGYSPAEFVETLQAIAAGDIDVTPLITGRVGLEGVADTFTALANPEQHCKILVAP